MYEFYNKKKLKKSSDYLNSSLIKSKTNQFNHFNKKTKKIFN
jgi:hypothetical protein